jgi:hypothetical protein
LRFVLVFGGFRIGIIRVSRFLVQVEAQFILTFMANREIGEDEIASFSRAVKISHSRDRHSSEDRDLGW